MDYWVVELKVPFLILCMYCDMLTWVFGVSSRIVKTVLYGRAMCMVGRVLWAF